MAFRHRQSDRIFEWATGMSIKNATLNFQKCVAENNQSIVGETNADIGGIGVCRFLLYSPRFLSDIFRLPPR
jgi:hypothetical protein